MADNKLQIYQGNSESIFCAVVDASDLQMDLTEFNAKFMVKKKADGDIELEYDHFTKDNSEGVILFNILAVDTSTLTPGNYVYSVDIFDSSNALVYTVVKDRFIIIDNLRYPI